MAGRGGDYVKKKAEGLRDFFIASYLKNTNFWSSVQGKKNEKNYKNLFKDGEHFFKQSSGERTEQAWPSILSQPSWLTRNLRLWVLSWSRFSQDGERKFR